MKNIKLIITKVVLLIILTLGLSNCIIDNDNDNDKGFIKNEISFSFYSLFENEIQSSIPEITQLNMYFFKKGVLAKLSDHQFIAENKISIKSSEAIGNKLYFIGNPSNVIDNTLLKIGVTTESDFLSFHTKELDIANGEIVKPFYVGFKDLTTITEDYVIVDMKRGYSPLDIDIDPELGIELENIKLSNVRVGSFIYKQTQSNQYKFPLATFEKSFSPAISKNTQGVFSLLEQNEQTSNVESVIDLTIKIKGVTTLLRAKLPKEIKRNNIHTIKIRGVGTALIATLVVSAWEDGDDIVADPDFDYTKIDTERSEIPNYVRISDTKDTLFIPSCHTTFDLTIKSNVDLDVQVDEGIVQDIVTVVNTVGDNSSVNSSFKLTIKPRIGEKLAYLKIRNKNYQYAHEEEIVLVLEDSKIKYSGRLVDYMKGDGSIRFEYADGDLGEIEIPSTSVVRYDDIKWLRVENVGESIENLGYQRLTVKGGFKPNNMANNGKIEEYTLGVIHQSGEVENVVISRVSNSLPVVKANGEYWCMYNLRGNTRKFEDQIMEYKENLFDFLKGCSQEDVIKYSGDGYKGNDLNGMTFKSSKIFPEDPDIDPIEMYFFENYRKYSASGHIGENKTCPDEYRMPTKADMLKVLPNNQSEQNSWSATGQTRYLGFDVVGMVTIQFNSWSPTPKYEEVNIFYTQATNQVEAGEPEKLVIYGIANQNDDTDYMDRESNTEVRQSYIAYGDESNVWQLNTGGSFGFNNVQSIEDGYFDVTTRYIRCIKESGYFLY